MTWVLLITLYLVAGDDPYRTVALERYDTKEECESERVRVTEAMEESYPDERDLFKLRCEERESNKPLPL